MKWRLLRINTVGGQLLLVKGWGSQKGKTLLCFLLRHVSLLFCFVFLVGIVVWPDLNGCVQVLPQRSWGREISGQAVLCPCIMLEKTCSQGLLIPSFWGCSLPVSCKKNVVYNSKTKASRFYITSLVLCQHSLRCDWDVCSSDVTLSSSERGIKMYR